MDNKKKNIIAISGPSGVGKGYVKSLIINAIDEEIFEPVVVTTREKRSDDNISRRAGLSTIEFEEDVKERRILFPHRPFEDENTPLYGY